MKKTCHLLYLSLFFLVFACTGQETHCVLPQEPDYSEESAWYKNLNAKGGEVDVFYIAPTCVWDWTDDTGRTIHFEDIYNPLQREALRPSLELAASIFAEGQNFYAPYYRQITLDSWMAGEACVEERFPYAMADVDRAFDYYLSHFNNGRLFILAGFSQGAKAVAELLKDMPEETHRRMIAAYVIGYRITQAEIASSPRTLIPASSDSDTGVIICYNSVASAEAICPVLSPSDICINPVNWRTDAQPAQMNDSVTVQVDSSNHILLVKGLDSGQYYLPQLGNLFKEGNYHLQELVFYQAWLKENVKHRTACYQGHSSSPITSKQK